ncbi:putative 2-aminoethylphosphonate ABC transporter ATP-binding protein [Ideonella sp. A 288]|uniref:putative 2-aminoethylphosphonate ABC transporter ATP-binding protein n=1 Tax=Ideonella sp. A 288 TaxID=1962181 RepID=UPI003855873E
MSDPYLRLTGIRKDFGAFTALKGIDLDIARGEFVCFLGPSGCGKTTLLRIVAGLEVQTAGRIELAGRDISTLPPAERDYGIVFQSYALFPNLSIADNVAYGLVNRKVPKAQARARVTELLALVGLPGSEGKYPAQLSGGQQQRIALARALATSPSLLLLDEPLSALDAIVRVKLRQEIRSLQRTLGVTTIMVTHDQEEAFAVADRIVVMNHGAIEQVGTAMDVYRDPATLFVADFVGRINALPATPQDGGVRVGEQVFRCEHASLDGHAAGRELRVYLRPEDVLARPIPEGDPNVFEARIDKIEFMGPYCLVRVSADRLGAHQLTVYLSLNYLAEAQLEVGSRLPLRLLPDRMRVFA